MKSNETVIIRMIKQTRRGVGTRMKKIKIFFVFFYRKASTKPAEAARWES